jgi:sugar phosphate isomerase/epimerase
MRLSVITDEMSMDLGHSLSAMKEYGCTGAEIRSLWGTNIGDLTDAQTDEALKLLDEHQMEVCCLASPLFKCELGGGAGDDVGNVHQATERTAAEQMDLLKRLHKRANQFGTKYMRTFAYWRRGELTPRIEDAIIAGMSDAVKYAEDNGVVLLMENEHDCYLGTGEETARFLSRVNSPALRACWDPGNAFFAGEKAYPDGYNAIRNYVAHVHVKDAELLASGKYRFIVMGEGEVDYKGHFAALKADGYKGYLSIETHYKPYGGTAEQGTRLSLQGLLKLLSEC